MLPTSTVIFDLSLAYKVALTVGIWLMLISLLRSLWETIKGGWLQLQQMHQIPCHNCIYFTGDYQLKCNVYPSKALNEDAIDCIDYAPVGCHNTQNN